MDEISLYEHILGIQSPWFVEDVVLDTAQDVVSVVVAVDEDASLLCPECQAPSPRYDKRRRQWRHLDTCQLQTYVEAEVPRVECKKHGCKTIQVPWAESSVRYTLLFERRVLDLLHAMSMSAVCRYLSLSWNAVDGIMQRAIDRGLAARDPYEALQQLYVDETSYLRQRQYVTVVSDSKGRVIYIADGSGKKSLEPFYSSLSHPQRRSIKSISMDMSPAYIHATLDAIPWAKSKIAFDRFHIARALNKAVDDTRRGELMRRGIGEELKQLEGSRYLWLKNGSKLSIEQQRRLAELRGVSCITAEAWKLKEFARYLWVFGTKKSIRKAWESWCDEADRSGVRAIEIVSSMIRGKLWGIVNACYHRVTNAQAESINSKIKMIKAKARGFRNSERFKRAIMFYCGGLDLYPKRATHHV